MGLLRQSRWLPTLRLQRLGPEQIQLIASAKRMQIMNPPFSKSKGLRRTPMFLSRHTLINRRALDIRHPHLRHGLYRMLPRRTVHIPVPPVKSVSLRKCRKHGVPLLLVQARTSQTGRRLGSEARPSALQPQLVGVVDLSDGNSSQSAGH